MLGSSIAIADNPPTLDSNCHVTLKLIPFDLKKISNQGFRPVEIPFAFCTKE
jgi:hypothetical protein